MLSDAVEFVKNIKKTAVDAVEAAKPVHMCYGEVVSAAPLKINVEQKMILDETHLILTRNVTDFNVRVSLDWETDSNGEPLHNHGIMGKKLLTVHNALNVGDRVIVVRQQGGQKFIVVDRIG